ncbi:MAG: hypothetical protein Q4G02_04120, partial [bacterium]|nr:hypothetical protein [bacterium]
MKKRGAFSRLFCGINFCIHYDEFRHSLLRNFFKLLQLFKFQVALSLALLVFAFLFSPISASAATLSVTQVPVGTVVKSGDLKFVKVNDNNLLVSLQSLTSAEGVSPLSLTDSAGLNLSAYQI